MPDPYREHAPTALEICAAALLQLHAPPALRFEGPTGEWRCTAGEPGRVAHPASQLFPPLFFVPYKGFELLKSGLRAINHPFAGWLVRTALELDRMFPGILRALRETLTLCGDLKRGLTERESVARLTEPLERLRVLSPDLAPARAIWPTEADFE
jgi:hypothetical protein